MGFGPINDIAIFGQNIQQKLDLTDLNPYFIHFFEKTKILIAQDLEKNSDDSILSTSLTDKENVKTLKDELKKILSADIFINFSKLLVIFSKTMYNSFNKTIPSNFEEHFNNFKQKLKSKGLANLQNFIEIEKKRKLLKKAYDDLIRKEGSVDDIREFGESINELLKSTELKPYFSICFDVVKTDIYRVKYVGDFDMENYMGIL